jgi:ribosomal protein S18 acetylase RimI-like enzyme
MLNSCNRTTCYGFASFRGILLETDASWDSLTPKGTSLSEPKMIENNVTIRPAAISDLNFIQNLSKKVFSQYGPYERILTHWFQSGTRLTLLALIDESPVAFAVVRLPEDEPLDSQRIGELLAIAVEPEKQGLGVGDLLIKEILSMAHEAGISILILCTATSNEPAQKLFKKHGFKIFQVEKGYYDGGQEAMMMYRMIS